MRILLILLLLTLINLPLFADTCFRSFEQDTSMADVIFVGKLYKISADEFWHRGDALTVFNFEIQESYKGLRPWQKYVSVIGPAYGCCNVKFISDSVYLVFAYGDGEGSRTYWTNDCSNSDLLSESQENIRKLGASIDHEANDWTKKLMQDKAFKKDSVQSAILTLKAQANENEQQNRILKYGVGLLLLIIGLLTIIIIKKNST